MERLLSEIKPIKPAIQDIWFDKEFIFIRLDDGEIYSELINRFPNLSKASPEQLKDYQLWNNRQWIHWESLDEDLSIDGFLKG